MYGEIENLKPTKISESYCLGEACMIIDYGNTARRTVAFKTKEILQRAIKFIRDKQEEFTVEVSDSTVRIITKETLLILETVNNMHALRLQNILENLIK